VVLELSPHSTAVNGFTRLLGSQERVNQHESVATKSDRERSGARSRTMESIALVLYDYGLRRERPRDLS
jgi:hypothetical protein